MHKIPELVELTGYPGAQKFVTALIQSLSPNLYRMIFHPPPPKKTFLHIQNDDDLDDRGSIPTGFSFPYIETILISRLPKSSINIYMVNCKLAPHLTLYYSKIQASALCTRCREFPEELRHIFLDCPRFQRMWKIVTYHLSIITSKPPLKGNNS